MSGTPVGLRLVMAFALALMGCPHTVMQDKQTGEDGFSKGAVEMVLDQGEATMTGIVTYPGGDRVDWRLIELPEKQRGTMDIKLTWTPPRPGLQLNFDVFNEWYEPIVNGEKQSKSRKKKRKTGKIRTASVDNAKGKYYIRVYADGRGDAGKYRLTVSFTEQIVIPGIKITDVELADPPRLPDLPEIEVACLVHDPANPACAKVCAQGAPPEHPPCGDRCNMQAVDVEKPDCQANAACPSPPDVRFKKCTPWKKFWPPCDPENIDVTNPLCEGVRRKPVIGRIVGTKIQGADTIITIGVGSNQKIDSTWSAVVLQGNAGKDDDPPLSGGTVSNIKIDKSTTTGTVRLTPDQVASNKRVRFTAPPPAPR